MDSQKRAIQNSSYYSNHYNNNYPINSIYSNIKNSNIHNSLANPVNFNKPQSFKSIFPYENRVVKSNRQNNIYNNYNHTYNNNNNNILNSSNNKSTKSINDINNDTKSNYSMQSNSSSNTIKSVLNTINKSGTYFQDISFQKNRKCPSDSLNFSNISQEGNFPPKYLSSNNSFKNDLNRKNFFTEQNHDSNNKQMANTIKQKIENARINDEIILPSYELNFESLYITKPLKIKGQQNSCLYINEGPIIINLENFINSNNKNVKSTLNNKYTIKFSQMRIVYTDNKINIEKKRTTLFKLEPGVFLELEDCDIEFKSKKNQILSSSNNEKKCVAFSLSSNKKNENINSYFNPTMLTLTNTRIHNFYQSIRAGKNCIVNINKSAFIQNYGKTILMINPISLNVNETLFQNNSDNNLYVEFIDEYLYEEKRKIVINKNEFDTSKGNYIYIKGIKNNKLYLSIEINRNNFHNNSKDGVLIFNVIYNSFEINHNIFKKNQGNGLNIQNSFFSGIINTNKNNNNLNNKDSLYQPIKIKDNQFIENRGFGLFVNDCIIEVISNKFTINRQSGMSLYNVTIEEQKGLEGINLGTKIKEEENSIIIKNIKKPSSLIKNIFYENGGSGLFIHGYPYHVNILESVFNNNCINGISIDLDSLYNNTNNIYGNNNTNNKKNNNYYNFNSLLNEFKSSTIKRSYDLANIRLSRCVIEKNMKAGISINSCLIYCEETFIINNIDYAISTKKKEFQHCFKEGKKNFINGELGGDWGQISLVNGSSCGFSCMGGGVKIDNRKKEEIVKQAPSFMDQSDDYYIQEDYSGKKYNSFNKNKDNNNISNQTDIINKTIVQNNDNKFNNKEAQNDEDKGCIIF